MLVWLEHERGGTREGERGGGFLLLSPFFFFTRKENKPDKIATNKKKAVR